MAERKFVKKTGNVKFGVKLTEAALKELDFLHDVNCYPALYSGTLLINAIRRYIPTSLFSFCHAEYIQALPLLVYFPHF